MPSALIEKSSYDPETRVLSVWLRTNGRRYDYQDVPPETYGAFRMAFSKGRFFNLHIRPRFSLRRDAERSSFKT
ncbi:MAG: KTSC domain-containing protein [Devosia sp.]